jgi:pimeloyl-ACP methyl ester carboxylesterase
MRRYDYAAGDPDPLRSRASGRGSEGAGVSEPMTTHAPDGRTLAYAVWGDPDGFPVLSLHGTPGCRLDRWPKEEVFRELGACYVTHDRAGYGRSDRHRGRSIADEAADVAAIADALGIDRFGVAGGSGGGPHALACGALLSERVIRVTCRVGAAPCGPGGLERDDWLAGMDPENVKEFGWAEAGEEVLTRELEREQAAMEARVAEDPATFLGDFDLSESDRQQLRRPELADVIRESTVEQAAQGIWGWVDDDLALIAPWGFNVASIRVPTLVWYGRADVLVPPGHGDWLAAHVPGCLVRVDDDSGHLGADPELEIAENVAWLRDGIPPGGAALAA